MPQITLINNKNNNTIPNKYTLKRNNHTSCYLQNNIHNHIGGANKFIDKITQKSENLIHSITQKGKRIIGKFDENATLKDYFKMFNSIKLKTILRLIIRSVIAPTTDIFVIQNIINKKFTTFIDQTQALFNNFIKSIRTNIKSKNTDKDTNTYNMTRDKFKEDIIKYCKTKLRKKFLIFIYLYITNLNLNETHAYRFFVEQITLNTYKKLFIKSDKTQEQQEQNNNNKTNPYDVLYEACITLLNVEYINKNIANKYINNVDINNISYLDIILEIYANLYFIQYGNNYEQIMNERARATGATPLAPPGPVGSSGASGSPVGFGPVAPLAPPGAERGVNVVEGGEGEGVGAPVPDVINTNIGDLTMEIKKLINKSDTDIDNEFSRCDNLAKTISYFTNTAKANRSKNRYDDILPYDYNYVYINEYTSINYINASWVCGSTASENYRLIRDLPLAEEPPTINFRDKEFPFIACQCPKENTIDDFWYMIVSNNVQIIVMLTQFIEGNKKKCHEYFPSDSGNPIICNSIGFQITLGTRTQVLDMNSNKITSTFNIIYENNTICNLTHYQFTDWPDHGTPNDCTNFYNLINTVKLKHTQQNLNTPIVVHCSAGVGRTGTYIAISNLFDDIQANQTLDVYECVLNLRKCRMSMVQNVEQYKFIYKMLKHHLAELRKTNVITSINTITEV